MRAAPRMHAVQGLIACRRFLPMLVLLASLTFHAGCGEDKPATEPQAPDTLGIPAECGRIHGIVRGARGPLQAQVEAYNPNTRQIFTTSCDSTGSYRLDIPRANYELFVTPEGGLRWQWMPDGPHEGIGYQIRLTWKNRYIRVDVRLGGIRLRMPLTDTCDSSPVGAAIYFYPRPSLIQSTPAPPVRPVDGWLDFTLDQLLPGRYDIVLRRRGQKLYVARYPNGYDNYIPVEAERLTDWVCDTPMPGRIRGRLTGPWPELVRELGESQHPFVSWIRLRSLEGQGLYDGERDTVCSDGSFCLDMMFPDSLRLDIGAPRWFSTIGFRQSGAARGPFVPLPGETLDLGELVGSALLLRFSLPDIPAPRDVWITLMLDEGREYAMTSFQPSGESVPRDRAGFSHVVPGMYYLRAQWYRVESGYPRWVEQWYPGVPDFAQAEQVNLTSTSRMQVREWVLRTQTVPPPGDYPAP